MSSIEQSAAVAYSGSRPSPRKLPESPYRANGTFIYDRQGNRIGLVADSVAGVGCIAAAQLLARLWAASGAVVEALWRLRRAEDDYIAARKAGVNDDDLRPLGLEWACARDEADDALAALNDPRTTPPRPGGGTGVNS